MTSPKYAQVQSGIINLIATENIARGQLLPTEKELAERFDVSLITIRRAVSHLAEKRIVSREQGRGTFVIANIEERIDSGVIALLEVTRGRKGLAALGLAPRSLCDELGRRGYRLHQLLADQTPDTETVAALKSVRGVIATGWLTDKWVQMLHGLDMPTVFLGNLNCESRGIPMVTYDWRQMTVLLAEQLRAKGARRLGLITGGRDYAPSAQMAAGFHEALQAQGQDPEAAPLYYTEGETATGIDAFLEQQPQLDGLLVEAGCYVHVLASLFNRPQRPWMGVLSVQFQFGAVCANTIEAAFECDIYDKAATQLLERLQSGKRHLPDVILPPRLQAAASGQSQAGRRRVTG